MRTPDVTATAELLEEFERALQDESAARAALRQASERVAQLVRTLQGHGVPMTRLAIPVAQVDGLEVTVAARQRIASRLRQRVSRVTRRHEVLNSARGDAEAAAVASEDKENTAMKRLIKKTVITEFLEPARDPELETVDEDLEDEEDAGDKDEAEGEDTDLVGRPRPRSGRRSR